MTNLKWVGGINAPRGMILSGRILYVVDNNRVVGIDVNKNAILNTYSPEEAKMFNDMETDKKGDVYTSDMLAASIYKLSNGKLEVWVTDDCLKHPNGL